MIRRRHPIARSSAPILRKTRPRRERKSPMGTVRRTLWVLFSRYVKERDGNVCFTCGASGLEGSNWHAGHLISGAKASTRYHPANVHSQCGKCNVWLRGNIAEYTFRHIDKYGEAVFRDLVWKSRGLKTWKRYELEELIESLRKSGADFELLYHERHG